MSAFKYSLSRNDLKFAAVRHDATTSCNWQMHLYFADGEKQIVDTGIAWPQEPIVTFYDNPTVNMAHIERLQDALRKWRNSHGWNEWVIEAVGLGIGLDTINVHDPRTGKLLTIHANRTSAMGAAALGEFVDNELTQFVALVRGVKR